MLYSYKYILKQNYMFVQHFTQGIFMKVVVFNVLSVLFNDAVHP
jgi:hypothetical protein